MSCIEQLKQADTDSQRLKALLDPEDRQRVVVILDNDSTHITWDDGAGEVCLNQDWLGNAPGVQILLEAIGIEVIHA